MQHPFFSERTLVLLMLMKAILLTSVFCNNVGRIVNEEAAAALLLYYPSLSIRSQEETMRSRGFANLCILPEIQVLGVLRFFFFFLQQRTAQKAFLN